MGTAKKTEAVNTELPKRKHPRLKNYDYSRDGYYHIVICTERNLPLLSTVGRGLDPAADINLTEIGKIAESQLLELEKRYPSVKIDRYAIMPTHIHAVIALTGEAAGSRPRPTLTDIVKTYKSMTTRLCNAKDGAPGRKIFQTSFYDEIIRNEKAYEEIGRYIYDNPLKWETERGNEER